MLFLQRPLLGATARGCLQNGKNPAPASPCLISVLFQVFGLGNKTYEHFNAMGKYVDKRLEELGAQRIFELGLGDDDGK